MKRQSALASIPPDSAEIRTDHSTMSFAGDLLDVVSELPMDAGLLALVRTRDGKLFSQTRLQSP